MQPRHQRDLSPRQLQILDTAMQLFAEVGYDAASMRDLATRLDMKASSLYNHFPSKKEILFTLVTTAMDDLLEAFARSQEGVLSPDQQIVAAMKSHINFHVHHKLAIQVTTQALKSLPAPERSTLVSMRKAYVKSWTDIIDRGVEMGTFTCTDTKIATYALIDMGMGVAVWYRDDGAVALEDLADIYADMALRSIKNT